MSHFEKMAILGMKRGVTNSKYGYNFDPRLKSPHVVPENCIFKGLMRRFFSNFKNEAEF